MFIKPSEELKPTKFSVATEEIAHTRVYAKLREDGFAFGADFAINKKSDSLSRK